MLTQEMIRTDLGNLRLGDTFYLDGEKYKASSLGDNAINNVLCINVTTKKRVWLDVQTKVDIDTESK